MPVRADEHLADIVVYVDFALISSVQHCFEFPRSLRHNTLKLSKKMSLDQEVISVFTYQHSESYFNGIRFHCLSLLKVLMATVTIWRKVSIWGCLLCCGSIAHKADLIRTSLRLSKIQQLTRAAFLDLLILWPKHYELTCYTVPSSPWTALKRIPSNSKEM